MLQADVSITIYHIKVLQTPLLYAAFAGRQRPLFGMRPLLIGVRLCRRLAARVAETLGIIQYRTSLGLYDNLTRVIF